MSRLAELQHSFQQCLLDPPAELAQPWIRAGGRARPQRQLAAYVHAYLARLTEVLGHDYPAVRLAIGDDAFEQLARDYVDTHPSRYFSLRDFGGELAAFVAAGDAGRDRPWLAELARFEWTLGLAFDAADAPLAGIAEMAGIDPADWPGLRFDPHPSIQRLDCAWNTPGMWSALTADEPRAVSASHGQAVPWLVWREQQVTRFRSLAPDEAAALDCLRGGGTFGDCCDRLSDHVDADAVPLRAATLLKGWLGQGLISRIRTGADG